MSICFGGVFKIRKIWKIFYCRYAIGATHVGLVVVKKRKSVDFRHAETDQDDMDNLLLLMGVAGEAGNFWGRWPAVTGQSPAPVIKIPGMIEIRLPTQDPWLGLKKFTNARIALGRTGVSIPTSENLQFKLAHAFARDAVFAGMDVDSLGEAMEQLHPPLLLHSKAVDRHQYLQRPDLGRRLDEASCEKLAAFSGVYDVCINVADGLSATAINTHALPLLGILIPILKDAGYRLSPLCMVEQGRVAISDEVGKVLGAKLSLILIGERPGLSSPDSMGTYLTYGPEVGNADEKRNCISNIGPNGLLYQPASDKILYLITESFRLQLSGVQLKDNSGLLT
jgi:ethanolamine ammonia-lyase small subunit